MSSVCFHPFKVLVISQLSVSIVRNREQKTNGFELISMECCMGKLYYGFGYSLAVSVFIALGQMGRLAVR